MIRVSAGTANVLGLNPLQSDVRPTTGYFLTGGRCEAACAFCPQSSGTGARLSRITWPQYSLPEVLQALTNPSPLKRLCFQASYSSGWYPSILLLLSALQEHKITVPVCVSCRPGSLGEVKGVLDAGADRVSIALDACTREVAAAVGRSWDDTWSLLCQAARAFPGRIGTHLIIGMGETEREAVECVQQTLRHGIHTALFAFTPIRGTVMAEKNPPPVGLYRRVQAALYLLKQDPHRRLVFDTQDRLVLSESEKDTLSPEAFETPGCPDCNRPYYNERPGGVLYNFPRRLSGQEFHSCMGELENSP